MSTGGLGALGLSGVVGMALALFCEAALGQRTGDPAALPLLPPRPESAQVAPVIRVLDREHVRAAGDEDERRGWLDVGLGWGRLHVGGARAFDGGSLVLDFTAGRWVSDRIAIGARLGGWTVEAFSLSDPREGESLSEAFLLLKIRPLASRPLGLTIAGGWVSYTANDPAAVVWDGDGVGWRAALEWDAWRSGQWSLVPALVASWGNIDPDARSESDLAYGGGALLVRARWHW